MNHHDLLWAHRTRVIQQTAEQANYRHSDFLTREILMEARARAMSPIHTGVHNTIKIAVMRATNDAVRAVIRETRNNVK